MDELKKHRFISLTKTDYWLLYFSNSLGKAFPGYCWSKKKKLSKLYETGADRIESKLNIVKIAKN